MSWQPYLSPFLNGGSALCLLAGFVLIRRKKRDAHKKTMLVATTLSALFLINYLSFHWIHGSTPYHGTGMIRTVYFTVLFSHTVLAIALVPLAGFTLSFAVRDKMEHHKKIARFTMPVWLYVSLTGIAVFFFLYG